jgi:hypothetical protein
MNQVAVHPRLDRGVVHRREKLVMNAQDDAREILVGLALGLGLLGMSATWWVWAVH